ncbi:4'-phosphopantetheinyl transferase superfamily protein [Streptomyces sp. NPDC047014]|uniref:4'-phosphopantetheinyl transferase family protein n=1 Tax=Streptomyces sp. NPDC047014 TaxID=3155736 RepID=UPI0033D07F27
MAVPDRAGLALAGPSGAVLAAAGDVRELLTRTERDRADALRSARDRADFLAAHALVRLCAGRLLGRPARGLTVVQRCEGCGGPHGRPRLAEAPGTGISLAHSRGWVAAAAAHGPVGVDVEAWEGEEEQPPDWRTVEAACTAEELAAVRADPHPRRAFLRQWVRKESLVKVGAGTLDEAARLDLPVYGRRPPHWRGWQLLDWEGKGAVGCVAAREEMRLRLLG